MKVLKNLSMRFKLTLITVLGVMIGVAVLVALSLNVAQSEITDTMILQFTHETSQIADQAAVILEEGGTVDDLQAFVEEKTSTDEYLAYAVVIDTNVTAVAHSDTDKIGKSYTDDTAYTVPAAQDGKVMTSKFWADVQKAWTYDVMCPIYVNDKLYGSMDVGIYNSEVSKVIAGIRNTDIAVAVVMIILMGLLVGLTCTAELKPFSKMVTICYKMGEGDFSVVLDSNVMKRGDEVGRMANAMSNMQKNLGGLINLTAEKSAEILEISEHLHDSATGTQEKATDIADKSSDAVEGTEKQTELTQVNSKMTEEISHGMEDIADNIMTVTSASSETVTEAKKGADKINVVVDQMGVIESKVSDTYVQIQQLEKMSDDIQNVIQLIADIASQTNLLALNASIEAARAGEQGKGFAVVADEVGHLAEQSRDAAADIETIIQDIQECINGCVKLMEEGNDSVKDGMNLAAEAKESFSGIIGNITQVSDEMTSVSAVTEEVTSGTTALNEAIMNISEIAETVAESTRSVAGAADTQKDMMNQVIDEVNKLTELSQDLRANLNSFKLGD